MLKKRLIPFLLLLLCLTGCGGETVRAEPVPEAPQFLYYHDGDTLWEIRQDGSVTKISEENCSICVDGVVYEIFGTGSADGRTESWGLRVDGETVYEEDCVFREAGDAFPRFMPVLSRDSLQVLGEYVYFLAYVENRSACRLCRMDRDGSDLTVFENFEVADVKLLSDGNTVYFLSGGDYYPAKLDRGEEEMVILEESTVFGDIFFQIASGRVWWKTPDYENGTQQLYSARALGGEMEEYPEFTGKTVYLVSGSAVYYRQEDALHVWDFTSMETQVYPLGEMENTALVAACDWGGVLMGGSGAEYWLLDFTTGERTQINLK